MKNLKNKIYSFLANTQGFYMNQYYSNFHNDNLWIALKDVEGGIYAVIISKDSEEDIDYDEAYNYLKTLGKNFLLNILVLVNDNYINSYKNKYSKIVYNTITKEVLFCSESAIPLKECINIIDKENDINKRVKIFKEYPVTMILILINVIIFIITAILSKSIIDINTIVLVECGAKVNYLINKGQIFRLLTAAFLHGGIMHILFNMYSLYIVGTVVEKIYGWKKYISIYILSALTSSILSYMLAPMTISVGASGAIFGILGAFLYFAIKERKHLQRGTLGNIIAVIVLNLYIGFTSTSIDNLGHIGGFLGGFILSIFLYKDRD
ncbi:rhomboid family intramembrane serine protease [Clostridium sp.]|uniref:rhomboid family intramembrane serine protease n=1 Tax=Clostridium sp. TaxID=1506 RepID=UPI0026DB18B1|nr:rhomboid family intramembrane serine protease [Clostridium sp.]MDO5038712.1 rhomboid family intramembrane serine protease [Clostridium sp.]